MGRTMDMAGRISIGDAGPKSWGQRIGLLGGTFDPIHNGHLRLAAHVLNVLELDSVLFIPAARPPHKGHATVTPFKHRYEMVKIAIRDSRFFVSDMETRRSGPSYSVDTLKELRGQLDAESSLFFIIGTDALAEVKTWKDWQQLLDFADLAVVARPDYPLGLIREVAEGLGRYSYDPVRSCWHAPDHPGRIYAVNMPHIEISSTDVRQKLLAGVSPVGLIPAAVNEYIVGKGLFAGP